MSIATRAADTYYTYRFLRILTTPWEEMDAFELGIIDENGTVLRKSRTLRTSEEKAAYTLFHRLVFNIKRLLEKLPLGRQRIASYAAALFLLREEAGLSEEQIAWVLDQMDIDIEAEASALMSEGTQWFVHTEDRYAISPGVYTLTRDIYSPNTAEAIAPRGSRIAIDEGTCPTDFFFGQPVYRVRHSSTQQMVYVTPYDIER